jgi:uncharacterized membrane protein (DUF4010 family)
MKDDLISLAIAIGVGLLVGLQRQAAGDPQAGIRTFPVVAMLGALLTMLGRESGGAWLPAAGFIGIAALLVVSNILARRAQHPDVGLTGEVSLLATFAVGGALMLGHTAVGLVVTGVLVVLLESKTRLHNWVDRFDGSELNAIARLSLIGLVILPVLPNRAFDPYGVLNPFAIWLMVVLIVGVSLAAYLVAKFLGPQKSTVASGILGGLISSTATTAGIARRCGPNPASAQSGAIIIVIASTIVFIRVIVEVAAVAPGFALPVLIPLGAMLAWCAAIAAGLFWLFRKKISEAPVQEAPTDLKGPIVFALFYAVILFAAAVARKHFGESGVYVVAAISGLTDMDAITLSTARLMQDGHLEAPTAWRVVLTGALSNFIFKAALASTLGPALLRWIVLAAFTVCALGGGALMAWWPG